jgi:Zn-dependent M28 family amino/carboxypeptidase
LLDLTTRLQTHLKEIIRDRDPYLSTAGLFYVREYIRSQLAQWGEVKTHDFTSQGSHQNLVLDLPGEQSKQPPILIGAHYDAAPNSPGADDNASGVAVLLELARHFYKTPARHPIRLVTFDFEETLYELAGSTHYARSLQGEPLRLMLSLEMLGYCDRTSNSQQYPLAAFKAIYPNRGDFIALVGNLKTIPDLVRLAGKFRQTGVASAWLPVPNQGKILPTLRRSDHAAFWDLGYSAVMVTDTAYLRNPHYHQPSDRLETLDLDFMTCVCQGLAIGLQHL